MSLGKRTKLSTSNDWSTPAWLFRYLDALYGPFDVDVAAASWNAKCARFYTKRDNGLVLPWYRRPFVNCPFNGGNKELFTGRGRELVELGEVELSTHLLPHDTSDGYWKRVVRASAGPLLGITAHRSGLGWVTQTCWRHLTVEVTEIDGRLSYTERSGATGTARHSSAVVVFARPGVLEPLQWDDVRAQLPVSTFGQRRKAA